jgi:branched-chain amino acid transport system permease protein
LAEVIQPQPAARERVWQEQVNTYLPVIVGLVMVAVFLVWAVGQLEGKSGARMVNTTITGLLTGGIYALVAVGIVIVNKASGVFNFAHGTMMLVSSLVFYTFFTTVDIPVGWAFVLAFVTTAVALSAGAPDVAAPEFSSGPEGTTAGRIAYVLAARLFLLIFGMFIQAYSTLETHRNRLITLGAIVLLTVLMTISGDSFRFVRSITGAATASVLMGFLIERLAIRPLISQPLFTMILMTLAVDRILSGITQLVWGSIDRPLAIFVGLEDLGIERAIRWDASNTFLDGQVRADSSLLVAFGLALAAFAVFVIFFRYTNVGLAMRATAENQLLAQSVGLRVRFILAVAWAIAAMLAMIAGVLQGGANVVSNNMPGVALRAFPAVLLGGLESVGGALLGGLIIGLAQSWGDFLYPSAETGARLAPYLVLMLVLVIRPDGLFGQKRIERI